MKISIVQENPVVGDVKGNLALALNAIEDLKKEKPDLVLFSEMFLTCLLYTSPSPRDAW